MRIDQWHSRKLAADPGYARAVAEVEQSQNLADEIVRRRVVLGLTQREIADLAGLTQPQISRLETSGGNPTSTTIAKVRAALDHCEAKNRRKGLYRPSNFYISFQLAIPA